MSSFRDKTGQTFGALTVLRPAGRGEDGRWRWECRCECGHIKVVRGSDMAPHRSTSCGCVLKRILRQRNEAMVSHGHARSHKPSREWNSWKSMIERCTKPYAPNYPLYGGRGVSVHGEWLGQDGFASFLAALGPRPVGYTLDRINPFGNYEPGNVRWANAKTQRHNQRTRRINWTVPLNPATSRYL